MFEKQIAEMLRKQEKLNKQGKRDATRDAITICPHAYFIEGTPDKPIKFLGGGRGRLTANGLISVTNLISGSSSGGATEMRFWMKDFAVGSDGIPAVPSVRLGTGTTSTIYSDDQLGTLLAAAPDSISGSVSNPSAGTYRITLTATWNAGEIANGTVITEAGFYGYSNSILQAFGATYTASIVQMLDRLCSTDSDFDAITVNASNPLTFYYVISVAFSTPT